MASAAEVLQHVHPSKQTANADQARELNLEFRGRAWEYFRVWIVNLCLTLLTAGIFSAWAKVRKKRYFYAHTTLDGTPFQYLGQPIPILKGRIIAAVLFVIYYFSSHFFISTLPYVLAAAAILAPWVIVRSAAFNARYSAFRNMTFSFDGGYWSTFKVMYVWGILVLVTFGLAFPWWLARFKRFIAAHTQFGGKHGELSMTGRQLFNIYALAGLMVAVIGVGSGFAAGAVAAYLKLAGYTAYLILAPIYAGYILAYAYVQARSGNLVWNNTRLGLIRFQSTLRARGLAKLYVTNALGIIISLGLLTPWAVMRTLQYRADNMRVLLEGEIADFVGSKATTVEAAGAEVGEFFDLDLSL